MIYDLKGGIITIPSAFQNIFWSFRPLPLVGQPAHSLCCFQNLFLFRLWMKDVNSPLVFLKTDSFSLMPT